MSKPKSLRIVHLADIHLGFRKYARLTSDGINQREADVAAAFKETIQRVAIIKPDVILIAGDLFHSVRPSNATLSFAFRNLKKLATATKAPIIIVAGNHESPRRIDTGSALMLLREIDGVFVADTNLEWFDFPELSLSVCAIPHAALDTVQSHELRARDAFKHNILVTHLQTGDSWMSDIGGHEKPLQFFNPTQWDYVALGHVHLMKQVGFNAFYSGSIEHTSLNIWAESDTNKGFLEFTLPEQSWKFHELTTPREILILDPLDGPYETALELESKIKMRLESARGGLAGKIVRLQVRGAPRELLRLIYQKAFKDFRAEALHLALEFIPSTPTQKGMSGGRAGIKRLEDELVQFCKENASPGKSDSLNELFKGYLKKIEEEEEVSV